MSPLIALLITEIVKYAPALAIELIQILSKPSVSEEDWDALKAKYKDRTYDWYMAQTTKPCE